MVEKWNDICLMAENVASEVLRCAEARSDLSREEMQEILDYMGDSEYVIVNDEKNIVLGK